MLFSRLEEHAVICMAPIMQARRLRELPEVFLAPLVVE
jgi:hypothetical protein